MRGLLLQGLLQGEESQEETGQEQLNEPQSLQHVVTVEGSGNGGGGSGVTLGQHPECVGVGKYVLASAPLGEAPWAAEGKVRGRDGKVGNESC